MKGKPDFLAVAHVGILNHATPQYLSIGPAKVNCSNAGILKNRTFGIRDIFIGERVQTRADERLMTNGKIDIATLRPLLFDLASVQYGRLGPPAGKCWSAGKALQSR